MSDDAERLASGQAWAELCERLKALGAELLGPAYPDDPRARAEGFRALTRLFAVATRMELEAGDPRFPCFVRYEEPWSQWGGPNPDNVYLRAAVSPAWSYRVRGDATGMRQALFSLHEGDMQLEEYGVYGERSLDDLEIGADGSLEIAISSEERPGNWIPLHPKARLFMIRIYQSDWERDTTPPFAIEREGAEGVPPPPADPAAVARGLERAVTWVERSVAYWNRYAREALEAGPPNVPQPARAAAGGADHILYGRCPWDLGADDALLLDFEPPDAPYWNVTIHTPGWFESGDFASRQTSLSGHQAQVDADGRVRLVLAHRDPGTPNWIDTEERPRGLLAYRFVWARGGATTPRATLLKLAELPARLPPDHPTVDPAERRRRLARRRELAWRRYL